MTFFMIEYVSHNYEFFHDRVCLTIMTFFMIEYVSQL